MVRSVNGLSVYIQTDTATETIITTNDGSSTKDSVGGEGIGGSGGTTLSPVTQDMLRFATEA